MTNKQIAKQIERILNRLEKELEDYEEGGGGFLGDTLDRVQDDLYNLSHKLKKG